VLSRVRGSSRASWWLTFVLLASLGGFWALGSAPTGAPDERDHVINASAVARGELVGDRLTRAQRSALAPGNGQKSAYRSLDVPELYGETNTGCFAFQKEVTAACLHFSGSTRVVPVVTNVAWYPPAYYALVGLLTRPVPAGSKALYAMRLVTVAVMAALLASAVASLRRGPSSRLRLLGFLGALTPMVLFLDASVNPNGPEIAAGLALWASGAVLVDEVGAGAEPDGRLIRRVGIAAVVLALSRQDSLLWLGLIVVVLLALAGRRGIASLWRATGLRIWTAVVAVCGAAQVAWILVVGTLSADHSVFAPLDLPAHEAIRAAIGRSPEWYHEMIGTFGWLDTPSPALTVVTWTVVIGALLALAMALGRRRWWLATVVVFAITFLLPIALEFAQAVGWATGHWQGRYALPFAVGVPLLATMSLERDGPGARLSASLLPVGLAAALGVASVFAFAQNVRRYTVGYDGHVWFFLDPQWSPPGGALLITVGFTVAMGLTIAWLLTGSDPVAPPDAALDQDPVDAPVATPAPFGAR
jgi:hypothetical protein